MQKKVEVLYLLYKISNIQQDSNSSSDLFQSSILANTNYIEEDKQEYEDMDVDEGK